MKLHKKFTSQIILLFGILTFIGCSNDEDIVHSEVQGFVSDIQDTTLTAVAHEITIQITTKEDCVNDLSNVKWDLKGVNEWDDTLPGSDKWVLNPKTLQSTNEECGLEWVKVKKETDGNNTYLKVTLSANETDMLRGIRIYVGYQKNKVVTYLSNPIVIWQKNKEAEEAFQVKVRYKGTLYSSMAKLDENEHLQYEDSTFASLVDDLESRNDLEVVVKEDGIVDYYDTEDIAENNMIKSLMQNLEPGYNATTGTRTDIPVTRSSSDPYRYMTTGALGYCALYDDKNFSDTHLIQNFTSFTDFYDQERMKTVGLNDKTTSLAVAYDGTDSGVCAVLTVWEDTDYNFGDNDRTKHRISFVASYYTPRLSWSNLKNLPCGNSRDSWNDRISAISFHFGHYGSYLSDY